MSDSASRLPAPAELARLLPAAIAAAGGVIPLAELEQKLGSDSRMKVDGVKTERDRQLIRETFQSALTILQQRGSLAWDGEAARLTDQGWEQARALGDFATGEERGEMRDDADGESAATIDVRDATQIVRFGPRDDGTEICGYLWENAASLQGLPVFQPPASALLDLLYPRAEINGSPTTGGFWTAIRSIGAIASAFTLLEQRAHVRLVGHVREIRAARTGNGAAAARTTLGHIGRGGRPYRRLSWERLVCEVLSELGGHASWQDIARAVSERPEVRDAPNWREETMQAVRTHSTGRGRGYFDVAEVGERLVYTLSEAGQKLASRRTVDERAPTLSKYIAAALAPNEDGKLTPFEVYALLHLAVELGRPMEAEALYHRLPENFPDEDRYFMLPHLFRRAEELAGGDADG